MVFKFPHVIAPIALLISEILGRIISCLGHELTMSQNIISLCTEGSYACAVSDKMYLKCWGDAASWGASGSTIIGARKYDLGFNLPNIDVGLRSYVNRVVCGHAFQCVVVNGDKIKCLGDNEHGQTGIGVKNNIIGAVSGHYGDNLPTVNLGVSGDIIDIALGEDHVCVVVAGKRVKCFGDGDHGQIGTGNEREIGLRASDMGYNLPYVNLGTGVLVSAIKSGSECDHTCAILSTPSSFNGKIKCWGEGGKYQLGYGASHNLGDDPKEMGDYLPVVDLGSESRLKQLALGYAHTCGLLFSDDLKCWGSGAFGQLGSGSTADVTKTGSLIPVVKIDSAYKIQQISAGYAHTCIVYSNHITFKCFGYNNHAQLGQEDTYNRGNSMLTTIPKIPAIDLGMGAHWITSVSSGKHFNCILLGGDSIKCFDANDKGQCAAGHNKDIGGDDFEMGTFLETSNIYPIQYSDALFVTYKLINVFLTLISVFVMIMNLF